MLVCAWICFITNIMSEVSDEKANSFTDITERIVISLLSNEKHWIKIMNALLSLKIR